jgi:hypothetical protein
MAEMTAATMAEMTVEITAAAVGTVEVPLLADPPAIQVVAMCPTSMIKAASLALSGEPSMVPPRSA